MLNFGFNEAAGWVHHQPHAADMQAEAVPRVWCLSNRDKKKMLVRLRIVELDVDSGVTAGDKGGYSRTLQGCIHDFLIWSFSIGPCGVQPVPDFTVKGAIASRRLFCFFVLSLSIAGSCCPTKWFA